MNELTESQPKPWCRLKNESAKAYYAFSLYRDLGPERSIEKACRSYKGGLVGGAKGVRYGRWSTWSMNHNWVERARSYDEHLDELGQEANVSKYREIHRLRLETSLKCYDIILKKLTTLDYEKLSIGEITKIFQIAVEADRIVSDPRPEITSNMTEAETNAAMPEVKHARDILNDPIARNLLCDLVERTQPGKAIAGRAGELHDQRELEAGPAPRPAQ